MRVLYVMRHCKSRWDEPDTDDHERGLNNRGKSDAIALGAALRERASPPDLIVSSTARRARATARRVASAWGYDGTVRLEKALYEGGVTECLATIESLPDAAQSVLLIGHNPTLETLLWTLGLPRLPLPTGATVALDLEIARWQDLDSAAEARARLRIEPRELPAHRGNGE